jgi:hypothetical protein
LITSAIVGTFTLTHVFNFKCTKQYEAKDKEGKAMKGRDGRAIVDLHKKTLEIFEDKKCVLWYLLAVGALGVHLWEGWQAATRKMMLNGTLEKVALLIFCHVVAY